MVVIKIHLKIYIKNLTQPKFNVAMCQSRLLSMLMTDIQRNLLVSKTTFHTVGAFRFSKSSLKVFLRFYRSHSQVQLNVF